jgi:hypothetical protein
MARRRRVRLMDRTSVSLDFPYMDEAGDIGVDLGSSRGVRSVAMPASATGVVRPVVRAATGLQGAIRAWVEHVSDEDEDI